MNVDYVFVVDVFLCLGEIVGGDSVYVRFVGGKGVN